MVYCRFLEKNDAGAIYSFSHVSTDALTGRVQFYRELKAPNILKKPENGTLYLKDLCGVAVKYKVKFSEGDFPEKVGYEYG